MKGGGVTRDLEAKMRGYRQAIDGRSQVESASKDGMSPRWAGRNPRRGKSPREERALGTG